MACKSCQEKREAYNVLHAAKDFLTGEIEYVDSQVYDQRVSICLNCPGNHFSARFQACKICKCFVREKASLKKSSCPKKFWGSVNE